MYLDLQAVAVGALALTMEEGVEEEEAVAEAPQEVAVQVRVR